MCLPLVLKLGGRCFWQIQGEKRCSGKQRQRKQDNQSHRLGTPFCHRPKNKNREVKDEKLALNSIC